MSSKMITQYIVCYDDKPLKSGHQFLAYATKKAATEELRDLKKRSGDESKKLKIKVNYIYL